MAFGLPRRVKITPVLPRAAHRWDAHEARQGRQSLGARYAGPVRGSAETAYIRIRYCGAEVVSRTTMTPRKPKTKKCAGRCGCCLLLGFFYRRPETKDGRFGKCKSCVEKERRHRRSHAREMI